MRFFVLILLNCFLVGCVSFSIKEQKEQRVALVIGNSYYQELEEIGSSIKDADAITDALRRLDFSVIKVKNAEQSIMKKALKEFNRRLKEIRQTNKNIFSLFYFSGHGAQNQKSENFLLPIEFKKNSPLVNEKNALKVKEVLLKMKENGGDKKNIIILDACRRNAFNKEQGFGVGDNFIIDEATIDDKPAARDEKPIDAKKRISDGFLIAYATEPGTTAQSKTFNNSPFTEELLNNLYITEPHHALFQRVRTSVMKNTNKEQIPWESTSLRDNVYFVPRRAYPHGGFQ